MSIHLKKLWGKDLENTLNICIAGHLFCSSANSVITFDLKRKRFYNRTHITGNNLIVKQILHFLCEIFLSMRNTK